jgi:tetraacyldisaccharide 4'-kinase
MEPLAHAAPPTPASSRLTRYLEIISGRARGVVPSLQRLGLWLASLPYGAVVRTRNWLYDRGWLRIEGVSVPVVCVGNLTVGGTGKTPCVEYIAAHYRRREKLVAILSRGYGGGGGRNDEARVLEDNLPDVPHYQGADRVVLARTAIEESESEVLVLDDGFQHRRLARNLDVVLVDATNPTGFGHLLPRGLLREPLSGLRRAGLVILTRCDQVTPEERDRLRACLARHTHEPVLTSYHRPAALLDADGREEALESLAGRPVLAFCGLGNPEGFRRTLLDLKADVREFVAFPDHHPYTRPDVDDLARRAATLPPEGLLITTQKDLVKLRVPSVGERPLLALKIRLHLEDGADELHRRLDALLPPDTDPDHEAIRPERVKDV